MLLLKKITVNHKDNGLTRMELHHRYFPSKFLRFWEFIWDAGFQSYQHTKTFSKLAIKSPVLPQLLFYHNVRTYFFAVDLNSEIFVGIPFCKVSGIYYKQNRQLFYYGRIAPYISLKIPERLNRVMVASKNISVKKIWSKLMTKVSV